MSCAGGMSSGSRWVKRTVLVYINQLILVPINYGDLATQFTFSCGTYSKEKKRKTAVDMWTLMALRCVCKAINTGIVFTSALFDASGT